MQASRTKLCFRTSVCVCVCVCPPSIIRATVPQHPMNPPYQFHTRVIWARQHKRGYEPASARLHRVANEHLVPILKRARLRGVHNRKFCKALVLIAPHPFSRSHPLLPSSKQTTIAKCLLLWSLCCRLREISQAAQGPTALKLFALSGPSASWVHPFSSPPSQAAVQSYHQANHHLAGCRWLGPCEASS